MYPKYACFVIILLRSVFFLLSLVTVFDCSRCFCSLKVLTQGAEVNPMGKRNILSTLFSVYGLKNDLICCAVVLFARVRASVGVMEW